MTQQMGIKCEAPALLIQPVQKNPEREKYIKLWEYDSYRKFAPGELGIDAFLRQARPKPGSTVIDFGAGTGRGALMLALRGQMDVTMVDFAPNCLDDDIREMLKTQSHAFRFMEADLSKPIQATAKYGYCTDVMEHIPTEDVPKVLRNILKAAEHVFFQISLEQDGLGELIDAQLHLTVQPYAWWVNKLHACDAQILWAHQDGHNAWFYVTGWASGSELVKKGTINTSSEVLHNNIIANCKRDLMQAKPHMRQDTPIIILGGGPSLNQFEDEIRKKREAGAKLICTNGTYQWCLDRGIMPSAVVIVDAREFNKRFVENIVPDCKYFLASQCDPSVFDAVPPEQTIVWHAAMTEETVDFINEQYGPLGVEWFPVLGGSTVMLRTIPLMRMLGYWLMEIYGFDSCIVDTEHHAYPQRENNDQTIVKVAIGSKVFSCHPWMASQLQEFLDILRLLADEVKLAVHGEGAIAHIISTAAEQEDFRLV